MYQINQITEDAFQTQTLVTPEGYQILFSISFVEMQAGWFIRNFSYLSFTIDGMRITNSPNMLHQFHNQLPFGLACFSIADREPSLVGDFFNGNSKLFILTAAEVMAYEDFLGGN